MKFSCEARALLDALSGPMAVTSGRHSQEIYQYALLETDDGFVRVSGADSEMVVDTSTTAEIKGQGRALIRPERLAAVLREAGSQRATVQSDGAQVTVVAADGEFVFAGPDPDGFPKFKQVDPAVEVQVDGDALKSGLQRTMFAIDTQSARYATGGVNFDTSDGLCLVATDSRRLAIQSVESTIAEGDVCSFVVPQRALQALLKVIDGQVVRAMLATEAAVFHTGEASIYTRLMEGKFPAWRSVIPDAFEHTLVWDTEFLLSAMRQAQITTSVESRGVDLEFDGGVRVCSQAADIGRASIDLANEVDGPDIPAVTIDPRFFVDPLAKLPRESSVSMKWNNPESALVLESGAYRCVVMPLSR